MISVIRREEMIMGHCGPIITTFNGPFQCSLCKAKIFYEPFNLCMGHLHRIRKLYVSNGPWPLPFPITVRLLSKKFSKIYSSSVWYIQLTERKNLIDLPYLDDHITVFIFETYFPFLIFVYFFSLNHTK
jgi:hypothetical protein